MKVLISEKLNAINKNTKWLSDITEIPYPTLSRIVKGEDLKSISVTTFDKICTALNCSISDIVSTEEDDVIKEKVKTENNKIILAERLSILKSLNKIKTILGHKYADEYDELAHRVESIFNETSFVNDNSYFQVREDVVNDITIDEIIDTYNSLNIDNLKSIEDLKNPYNILDPYSGSGAFLDESFKEVMSKFSANMINMKINEIVKLNTAVNSKSGDFSENINKIAWTNFPEHHPNSNSDDEVALTKED